MPIKSVATPVDASTRMIKAEGGEEVDQSLYQSAVGSLLYLSGGTRHSLYVVWPSSAHSPQSVIGQLLSVYFAT